MYICIERIFRVKMRSLAFENMSMYLQKKKKKQIELLRRRLENFKWIGNTFIETYFPVYVNTSRSFLFNLKCNSFSFYEYKTWTHDNLFYFCIFILFEKPLFDERSRKNWVLLSQTTFAFGLQF